MQDDPENFSHSPDGGTERAKRFSLLHSLATKFLHDVKVSAGFAGAVDIVESAEQKGVVEAMLWLGGERAFSCKREDSLPKTQREFLLSWRMNGVNQ